MSIQTPSVLAFERKLDPSDAVFAAGRWDDREHSDQWAAVRVREKAVRGTISNRLKGSAQDAAKLDAAIENPNLQTVDVASLPMTDDTLRVRFTLRVLPGTGQPSACNEAGYRAKLLDIAAEYARTQGFAELARRYAHNLANGRFLWRNRVGAETIEVRIDRLQNGQAECLGNFDALAFSLRDFVAPADAEAALARVADTLAQGLRGDAHVLLQITAHVRVGAGQEVFPSQELILDRARGDKSKTLYRITHDIAAMHSQKIGNAIRAIDTWYQGAEENGPIAIEPYGAVTTQGKAYRQPKGSKDDFYTLLDGWMLKDKVPGIEQQHYLMAVLIRGGVFGEA